MRWNLLKTLPAVLFCAFFTSHCAAQSSSLIPNTLSASQKSDFQTVASSVPNPCPEEELSGYKTLYDVLNDGKNCHEAYILSSQIEYYLKEGVAVNRVESYVRAEARQLANPNVFKIENRPRLGEASAPVEIVVFSDFQCPFCSRAATTLHKVYEDRKDAISVVFKNLPLQSIHPYAAAAALVAAYAHKQGRFWEFHDKLFENQNKINPDYLTELLNSLGTEPSELFDPEKGQQYGVTIVEDLKDAENANVGGTPTLFINGVELTGGLSEKNLLRRIDAEVNAPESASKEVKKLARFRALQTCPYPDLKEHYSLLSNAARADLSMLTNSSICPCPQVVRTLHECAAESTCEAAVSLVDHIMTRLNEGASKETLLLEIDAFVERERSESHPEE